MIANDRIREKERDIEAMGIAGYRTTMPIAVGELIHEPTNSRISCYKIIGKFQAWMLYKCFGLKYRKL